MKAVDDQDRIFSGSSVSSAVVNFGDDLNFKEEPRKRSVSTAGAGTGVQKRKNRKKRKLGEDDDED